MISLEFNITVPKKYKSKKFADDVSSNLMGFVHRYVREELRSRENYHFQMGNISPWNAGPGAEERNIRLNDGWAFRKKGQSLLATNNLMKATDIYNGTEPYCSRYVRAGKPKEWRGAKKMHFWYQGREMFRYCVGGIPRGGYASSQLHSDIENAAKFGIQKGKKAFSKYMRHKHGGK